MFDQLPFLLKLWSAIGALDYGERASALFAQLLALAELFEGVPAEAFGASKQCYRLGAGSAARRSLGATRSSRLRSHSHARVLGPLDTAVRSWTGSDLHVPPKRSRSSQKCGCVPCPDNFSGMFFNSRAKQLDEARSWRGFLWHHMNETWHRYYSNMVLCLIDSILHAQCQFNVYTFHKNNF